VPGHVGALDPTVQFDIQRVPGFKNMLFGGEGLFLAVLAGPCRVAEHVDPQPRRGDRALPADAFRHELLFGQPQ
jgi:uncharacterized protein (AIM24 family)